jgi:hypothetical protein
MNPKMINAKNVINYLNETILTRKAGNGGFFPSITHKKPCPVATSWAILACLSSGIKTEEIKTAQAYLSAIQREDGRICIDVHNSAAFWPTALAILAWQGASEYRNQYDKAIQFLLNTTGIHFPKEADAPTGHDTSIHGWPWIENTHSWIEPTALSILALKIAGHTEHVRVKEGIKMIMNRQLNNGGWNYGNTTVFGRELYPMPDSTAIAISALYGSISRPDIDKSIDYLKSRIEKIKAPFSLGWGILGLSVWDERPGEIKEKILESLNLQKTYGEFQTSLLSLLLISYTAPKGLQGIFQTES